MKQNEKLLNFISWNAINFVASVCVSLASIPVYYKNLLPAEFAALTLFWSVLSISGVLDFGVGRSLTREIAAITNESRRDDIRVIVTNGTLVSWCYSFFASVLIWIFLGIYFKNSVLDIKIGVGFGALISFSVFSTLASNALLAIFEGMHQIKLSSKLRIIGSITFMGGPALLMAQGFVSSLFDILLIVTFARATQFFVCMLIVFRRDLISLNKLSVDGIKQLLSSGKWLTASNVVSIGMTNIDRFIIGHYRPAAELGSYSIASELIQRGVGILSVISASLFPLIARSKGRPGGGGSLRSALNINIIIGIAGLFFGYIFVDKFLILWLGGGDIDSISLLVKLMLLGWMASGFGQIFLADIHASGNTRGPAIIHCCEAIFVIPLMVYATSAHGAQGAAAVWCLRSIGDALVLKYFSSKV